MPVPPISDVGAGAADQHVVAVAALQPVFVGAAGDGVVEAVADAGEVADAVVAEDLDVGPGVVVAGVDQTVSMPKPASS